MKAQPIPKGHNNAKSKTQMKKNGHHKTVKNNHQHDVKDYSDEEKVKLYIKEGNSTMLLARMRYLRCISLKATIERFFERTHEDMNIKFIITK